MSTETATALQLPATEASQELYRFSVDQYHRMIAEGILTENDRVQLLEGALFEMAAIGSPHTTCVQLLANTLGSRVGEKWHVRIQQPLTFIDSEPEPDVAVVRGKIRDYTSRHPSGADTPLIVEVADTSLQLDRQVKLPIYAEAGVPEYWIVNLNNSTVEVHRDPRPADENSKANYASRETFSAEDAIAVSLAGELLDELTVSGLLP